VAGKPRFTRRSLSLRQHGRAGFAGAVRSRQASLELSPSPARSALLPEQHTPPLAQPVPRKSNWEVIEHFSSSSGSLTRSSKPSQSANLLAVSCSSRHKMKTLPLTDLLRREKNKTVNSAVVAHFNKPTDLTLAVLSRTNLEFWSAKFSERHCLKT
jgi:hypothetical protein